MIELRLLCELSLCGCVTYALLQRHFQVFGGAFPNPNPFAAFLASTTSRIRLRAGSVNSPQHASYFRIAEDWAVVDNLSNGRVDIAFGAGWNVVDFAMAPNNFLVNKVVLWESIRAVRTLWQGATLSYQLSKQLFLLSGPLSNQPFHSQHL